MLQISIDYSMPLPQLYELYGRLRAMRRRGVIFIGSGNIVHALGRVKWDGGTAYDWATQLDTDTAVALRDRDIAKLTNPYGTWSEARIAVPSDDHYRPMIASVSLLEDGEYIRFFNDTIDMGSIGMRSFITV